MQNGLRFTLSHSSLTIHRYSQFAQERFAAFSRPQTFATIAILARNDDTTRAGVAPVLGELRNTPGSERRVFLARCIRRAFKVSLAVS